MPSSSFANQAGGSALKRRHSSSEPGVGRGGGAVGRVFEQYQLPHAGQNGLDGGLPAFVGDLDDVGQRSMAQPGLVERGAKMLHFGGHWPAPGVERGDARAQFGAFFVQRLLLVFGFKDPPPQALGFARGLVDVHAFRLLRGALGQLLPLFEQQASARQRPIHPLLGFLRRVQRLLRLGFLAFGGGQLFNQLRPRLFALGE